MRQGLYCPSCGSPITPEARFCGNCGAALEWKANQQMDDNFIRSFMSQSFRNILIFGLLIVTIWAVLAAFVPEGGWMILVNIAFFLLSIIFFGFPLYSGFRMFLTPIWAWFVSTLIWLFFIVVVRSIISFLFGIFI
ncbi:MAG: zinc ribbon domain-containing protein [Chloroflexi bacterium]|nr:zinc ribbon domain-containing protein [Chloroflexota bacterium]